MHTHNLLLSGTEGLFTRGFGSSIIVDEQWLITDSGGLKTD